MHSCHLEQGHVVSADCQLLGEYQPAANLTVTDCLGLHLARIELRLATAHFFRQFPRSEVSSREGMSDEDMEQVLHFLLSTKGHRCLLEVQ